MAQTSFLIATEAKKIRKKILLLIWFILIDLEDIDFDLCSLFILHTNKIDIFEMYPWDTNPDRNPSIESSNFQYI